MSGVYVKTDTEEGVTLEIGRQIGNDAAPRHGYHLVRYRLKQEDTTFEMTCAILGRDAKLRRMLCDSGVMPSVSLLLRDFAKLQKYWAGSKRRRLEPSFGAFWQERGARLRLKWIADSSIRQYLHRRGVKDPVFDTLPNAVNSSLWLEGMFPDGSNLCGLLPLEELIIRPPSALLTTLLDGNPAGMLAWKFGKHADVRWKFPRAMPKAQQLAIVATKWSLTETPEL